MNTEFYLIITLIFSITGAVIAVETKNLLSSVISLGALGLGLSIAFLFLQAPDLAIVQIPVEVIMLIFLIRATLKRDIETTKAHIYWPGIFFTIIVLTAIVIFGYISFKNIDFGNPVIAKVKDAPSNVYLKEGLKQTGAANIVAAIILDYRGYDTLGEATVLFVSILGALTILRSRARIDRNKLKNKGKGEKK